MKIEEIIHEYGERIKAQRTIVFCGAGISIHSGLPSATDFVNSVLNKLDISNENVKVYWNRKEKLPFESFMETLYENTNIDLLLDIFDSGEPNTNHILLAKLAKAGYLKTICTTNFDMLIEKALNNERLVAGEHYQVFYKQKEFDSIDWDDSRLRLIKIHGSVVDKKNISIMLQQVANKEFLELRGKIIENIFSTGLHDTVLVLGYSCSDIFDISPCIESIYKDYKEIILVEHQAKESKHNEEEKIEDIEIKVDNNPFQKFTQGKRIFCNTDKFMKTVWEVCIEDEYFSRETKTDNNFWKTFLDEWSLSTKENYSDAISPFIAGVLFFKISEFERAKTYFTLSLNIAKEIGDQPREGACLGNLGLIHDSLGEFQKAIQYYERALVIARKYKSIEAEGNHLANTGLAHFNLGNFQKAIEFLEPAIEIAIKTENHKKAGNRLNTLGSIYRNLDNYEKALECFMRAKKISEKIGDIQTQEGCLSNIGIVFCKLGEHQKGVQYFKEALQLAEKISNKKGQVSNLSCLGAAYGELGAYQEAIKYSQEALKIADEIGDIKGEVDQLYNLGSTYDDLGKYQEAIESYEKALIKAREIGNQQKVVIILGNMGIAYENFDKAQEAIHFYLQAIEIASKVGDKHGECEQLSNLGTAFSSLCQFHKALEYQKKGLKIAEEIGIPIEIAKHLGNIGLTHHNMSEFQKAVEYYEKALVIFQSQLGNDHDLTKSFEDYLSDAKEGY